MPTLKSYTDEELIAAITTRADVNGAITQLYKTYYYPLERYVVANSGNEMDAEDLIQEVMVAFVDLVSQGKYRGEASVKSFLYTLARNLWVTELRKRGETCRKILTLFYYHDLPMREILKQTNYENEQVLRNRKYKCLKEIAELIQRTPSIYANVKAALQRTR